MKRKPNYKIVIAFGLLLIAANCFAQNDFAYKAILGEVKQAGFYKIVLPPDIIAKCQYYLEDIRILDDKSNQAAYIIKQDAAQFVESSFMEFPIIKKTKEIDKQTHIVIGNISGKAINDLLLITSNMDAKRMVNISGSNDLKDWFIIKEGVLLDNYFSKQEEELVQTISLPTVNYKYFQVTIIGKDILPFNVVKAGIYKENYTQGKYVSIANPRIVQKDSSDKRTYVQLIFDEAYQVHKLVLEVEGPRFFNRNVSLYLGNYFSTKTPFTSFINSNNTELVLGGMKSKEYLLVINNDDNTPLKIASAKPFQLAQYLLTYLETGKNYIIAFGDSFAKAPVYDLNFFKDSVGKNPLELAVGSITQIKGSISPPSIANRFPNRSKILLWSIIAIISILLLAFTYKMTKEISKTKNNADL